MAEKLEDLNLPNLTVQKIIKDAIPDSVFIGKDARAALSKAASVFILYVTSQATKEAQKLNRKTLLGQDILAALQELEFEEFVDPLQVMLKDFRDTKPKKVAKGKKGEEDADAAELDDSEELVGEPLEENMES